MLAMSWIENEMNYDSNCVGDDLVPKRSNDIRIFSNWNYLMIDPWLEIWGVCGKLSQLERFLCHRKRARIHECWFFKNNEEESALNRWQWSCELWLLNVLVSLVPLPPFVLYLALWEFQTVLTTQRVYNHCSIFFIWYIAIFVWNEGLPSSDIYYIVLCTGFIQKSVD